MNLPSWYKDLSLLVLRVALASIFLYHGWMKLGAWQTPDGSALMRTLFVVEVLGGLLVLLGAWTRYAAAALAIVMIGAIYYKMTGQFGAVVPFASGTGTGWEFDLINFAAAFALTGIGAGAYGIDGMMRGKSKKKK